MEKGMRARAEVELSSETPASPAHYSSQHPRLEETGTAFRLRNQVLPRLFLFLPHPAPSAFSIRAPSYLPFPVCSLPLTHPWW